MSKGELWLCIKVFFGSMIVSAVVSWFFFMWLYVWGPFRMQ